MSDIAIQSEWTDAEVEELEKSLEVTRVVVEEYFERRRREACQQRDAAAKSDSNPSSSANGGQPVHSAKYSKSKRKQTSLLRAVLRKNLK